MSFEAKALLVKEIERNLASDISTAVMQKVLCTISDSIANYSIEALNTDCEFESDDFLESYLSAIKISGRSEKTVERYRYLISKLMSSVKTNTRNITVHHIRNYLSSEKKRGISDRTLEGVRQVFSAYFNWLHRERLIDFNPIANVGAIKCPKKIKDIYSEIDIDKLRFRCSSLRDRAIVSFLLSTGCRISEMVQLNRSDIDLSSMECIVFGKGAKERTVYMNQVCTQLIKEYLSTRRDNYPALFIGKGTERLSPAGVRYMMKKLGRNADVNHVHPHKFRRTLATNLIKHGMPIQEVAAILGHDKLDTTMQYVVLDKTDIKNAYRKYA